MVAGCGLTLVLLPASLVQVAQLSAYLVDVPPVVPATGDQHGRDQPVASPLPDSAGRDIERTGEFARGDGPRHVITLDAERDGCSSPYRYKRNGRS